MEADRKWDRFSLEVFCQHCGQYLTAFAWAWSGRAWMPRGSICAKKRKPTRTP